MIQTLKREQYNLWNSFIRQNNGSFLQSSEWPAEKFFIIVETTTQIGADQTRINADTIIAGCKVEERTLWLGKVMWLVRRAPLAESRIRNQELGIKEMLEFLIQKARDQRNVVMIRIQDSRATSYPLRLSEASELRVTRPKFLFHIEDPATTLMVDLSSSEDELMREMHEKTRYNIRLAEKKGVVAREGGLDEFYLLYSATNQRKGLRGFSKAYFENIIKLQAKSYRLQVFVAYHDNIPLASNLLVCFGDTVTYLFGGTSDEHRELMAPHLLHWECIRWAKVNGYRWYDWWGINSSGKSLWSSGEVLSGHGTWNTPATPDERASRGGEHGTKIRDWNGITRFKKGFVSETTGRVVEYGETIDIVINPWWYKMFSTMKKVF